MDNFRIVDLLILVSKEEQPEIIKFRSRIFVWHNTYRDYISADGLKEGLFEAYDIFSVLNEKFYLYR